MSTEIAAIKLLLSTVPDPLDVNNESERRGVRLTLYQIRQLAWTLMCEINRAAMRDYLALLNAALPPPKAALQATRHYTVDDL